MSYRARAIVIVAAFLLLHVVLAVVAPARFWGVSFLAYLPSAAGIAFGIAVVLLLLARVRRAVYQAGSLLPNPWSGGRRGALLGVGALALALLAFVLCRSAVHLLGDGYLYIREMDRDAWALGPRVDRAPLTFWIVRGLHLLMKSMGAGGEMTYRTLSTAAGLLYLLTAAGISAIVATTRTQRWVLWSLLVTTGAMQVFFGYVENYGFLLLAVSLYLLAGLLVATGRAGSWLAGVTLGVLLPLHFSTAAFFPSYLALLWIEARARGLGARAVLRSALLLVLPLALGSALLLLIIQEPLGLFHGVRSSQLLPFLAAPDQSQHYRLLSFGHLLDLVNLLLLAVPVAVLVLVMAGPRAIDRSPESWFLGIAALGGAALAAVLNPEVGFFRDWDILALLVFPLGVWAAARFVRSVDATILADHGTLLVGACLLHTALWVGVNASRDSASRRFQDLLEGAPLSRHALSYGWETLGTLYERTGRSPEAFAAFEKASEASGGNARHWISLGGLHVEAGRYPEAIDAYERAIEKAPDRADAHLGLARAYLRSGNPTSAGAPLARARATAPGNAEVWLETGNMHFDLGRHAEALESYDRAITLMPRHVAAHTNRASTLYALERYEEAVAEGADVLELSPDLPEAIYIQGASLWALGRHDEARERFRRLLEVDPQNAHAELVRRILAR